MSGANESSPFSRAARPSLTPSLQAMGLQGFKQGPGRASLAPPPPSGDVEVVVKVRPLLDVEVLRGEESCLEVSDDRRTITLYKAALDASGSPAQKPGHSFTFDNVFPPSTTPADIFQEVALPAVSHALQGYHSCILAYGQTGSGKTYTMEGPALRDAVPTIPSPEEEGLIISLCRAVFEEAGRRVSSTWSFHAEVSHFEVYNEKVRCLLQPRCSEPRIREHPVTGPYVDGATKCTVKTAEDIAKLLKRASRTRTVGATKANDRSSRSHGIFMLTFTQIECVGGATIEKESRMTLVDLAGSERVSAAAPMATAKEGSNINKSLATLGTVINVLADTTPGTPMSPPRGSGSPGRRHVPYRNSALTWILKESLGGNSLTKLVCALPPCRSSFELTLSTLRFAERAKRIVTRPVVNEDPSKRKIRLLMEEVDALKTQLARGGTSGVAPFLESPGSSAYPETDALQGYDDLPTAHRLRESETVLEALKLEWTARVSQFAEFAQRFQDTHAEMLSESVQKQESLGCRLEELVGSLQSHAQSLQSTQEEEEHKKRRHSMELSKIREALEEVKTLVKRTGAPRSGAGGAGVSVSSGSELGESRDADLQALLSGVGAMVDATEAGSGVPPDPAAEQTLPLDVAGGAQGELPFYSHPHASGSLPEVDPAPAPAPALGSDAAVRGAVRSEGGEGLGEGGVLGGGAAAHTAPPAPPAAAAAQQPEERHSPPEHLHGAGVDIGRLAPSHIPAMGMPVQLEARDLTPLRHHHHQQQQQPQSQHQQPQQHREVSAPPPSPAPAVIEAVQQQQQQQQPREAAGRLPATGGAASGSRFRTPSPAARQGTPAGGAGAPHSRGGGSGGWDVVLKPLVECYGTLEAAFTHLSLGQGDSAALDLDRFHTFMQGQGLGHLVSPFLQAISSETDCVSYDDLRRLLGGPPLSFRRAQREDTAQRSASGTTSLPAPPSEYFAGQGMEELERVKAENARLRQSVEQQGVASQRMQAEMARLAAAVEGQRAAAAAQPPPPPRLTSPPPPSEPSPPRQQAQPVVGVDGLDAAASPSAAAAAAYARLERESEVRRLRVVELENRLRALGEERSEATVFTERQCRRAEDEVTDLTNRLSLADTEVEDLRRQLLEATEERDALLGEQRRWESDIAVGTREKLRLSRELGEAASRAALLESTESAIAEMRDENTRLRAENRNAIRLLRHREAKQEKEKEAETERSEMMKKSIAEAAAGEVSQVKTELSDLTKICASQQALIGVLEAELGETKHNMRVVKEVGDKAVSTLSETLKTTLEKLNYYEAQEEAYSTAASDLGTMRDENIDLKGMVHSLQKVLKQQTEALAAKELQLMRATGGSTHTALSPPQDLADGSDEWRDWLRQDFAP